MWSDCKRRDRTIARTNQGAYLALSASGGCRRISRRRTLPPPRTQRSPEGRFSGRENSGFPRVKPLQTVAGTVSSRAMAADSAFVSVHGLARSDFPVPGNSAGNPDCKGPGVRRDDGVKSPDSRGLARVIPWTASRNVFELAGKLQGRAGRPRVGRGKGVSELSKPSQRARRRADILLVVVAFVAPGGRSHGDHPQPVRQSALA